MPGQAGPKHVICFGTDWYVPLESSVKQVVGELRQRGARVLWINPLPIRFPDVRRPDFWKKVKGKARTHARFLAKVDEGLHVYSPFYLPVFQSWAWRVNRWLVSLQVATLRIVLGLRSPLVVGSEFTCWFAMPAIRRDRFFFHFADKISAFREVSARPDKRRVLEDMEREIIANCSLAGCSSRSIHAHVLAQARRAGTDAAKILYLPHAINHRLFADASSRPRPADLAAIPGPIAGYFGSLTEANDKATFLAAARALPDWSFVFVGQVRGDYGELDALPNVHFLGPKPHGEIPAYGAGFDVCFMGWLPHEWITNCFPLKTLEYLALGKPIVCSVPIAELRDTFPDLIVFTETAEQFTAAVVAARGADSPALEAARRRAVGDFTWQAYVDKVLENFA
jgi:glycosyltransferase involved in cell wall biosynthesis